MEHVRETLSVRRNALRRRASAITLLTLAVFSLGCMEDSFTSISHHHEVGQGEISPGELYEEITRDGILVIDLRSDEDFEREHIPSAMNIPLEELSLSSMEKLGVSEESKIVVYHKSSNGGKNAQKIMNSLGFREVSYLNGGITHWMEDGLTVEKGVISGTKSHTTETDEGGPKISFDRTTHDFDRIRQFGGIVSTNFTVRNLGDETLEIGEISTSCGCTTANITKRSIEPEDSSILAVFFNPNLHEEPPDEFTRTVFIPSNDPQVVEAEIKITVDIMEGE